MLTPPLALYVHLPWCVKKCPYCDFNSHTAGRAMPRAAYLDALCTDLDREARKARGRQLVSVFLGGGTPSLFSGAEIGRLLDAVRACFALAEDAEITMEANPGTVERDNLAGYRTAGVNRLSLGAQSFDDAALARLGRIHSAADVESAFREARGAGFDNVNLDLMYALPGQSLEAARADVARALALGPEHVSYYQLTLEPNTVFHHRPPKDLPDEDAAEAIEARGHALLAAAGYRRYEISAFAREGYACRHNLNYWSFGDYLAVGAGARGKLTTPDGRVLRYGKANNPLSYIDAIKRSPAASPAQIRATTPGKKLPEPPATPLGPDDLAFEYLLNALRLPDGFSEAHFSDRTGLSAAAIAPRLERAAADGLMERGPGGHWRPSGRGLRFLNDLQARFLPA